MTDIKEVIAKLKAEREEILKKFYAPSTPGMVINIHTHLDKDIEILEKYLEPEKPEDKCGFKVDYIGEEDYIIAEMTGDISFSKYAFGIYTQSDDIIKTIRISKSQLTLIIEALTNAMKFMKD